MEGWSVENWIAIAGLALAIFGLVYRVGRMEGVVRSAIDALKEDLMRLANEGDNRYGEVRLALHAHEEECGKREERHAVARSALHARVDGIAETTNRIDGKIEVLLADRSKPA